MTGQPPGLPQDQEPRRPPVVALLVVALLVLGGLFLVHVLRDSSKLQDCVMSGRTNCAPIDPAATGN
jgi:hypothetical protein